MHRAATEPSVSTQMTGSWAKLDGQESRSCVQPPPQVPYLLNPAFQYTPQPRPPGPKGRESNCFIGESGAQSLQKVMLAVTQAVPAAPQEP